ncbi:ATP12 family chaperone protein [Propylenella binzhouense]|uniref:ATPase n=1 Tax=Propylenella binzhouense TaxID=2555902 RepID=A0A964WV90_9HYPH|nr:ATP12 family protein [Propylenella binzhouense]MYZ49595.1 ATPase [Propylenella binzhouense]
MQAEGRDPIETARRLSAPDLPKRFYSEVSLAETAGGWAIRLDGRGARTPARNELACPDRRFAEAVAAEWAAQSERIDPGSMPATRLANTALDGVAREIEAVRDGIAAFAESDLLCYRADAPEGLVAEQRAHWDPLVAATEARLGRRVMLAEGIMHVPQLPELLAAVRAEIGAVEDPFRLAALHVVASLTGSAFIALALGHGAVAPDAAWAAAHVDEDWNIRHWGEDAEATARRDRRRAEFDAAALVLAGGR